MKSPVLGAGLVVFLTAHSVFAGKTFSLWSHPSDAVSKTIEVDPYYTALDFATSLASDSIPRVDIAGERAVYWHLMKSLPYPREMLLEGSVNPLPITGWMLRSRTPDAYHALDYGHSNVIQSLTEGFPEPWALSLFFGNVVHLVTQPDTGQINGVAYSGLLVSWGAYHLHRNQMLADQWVESEIKLKGDDIRPGRKLGWSFRVGNRQHFHRGIRDTWYASLLRRRTDFRESGMKLLRNGHVEFRMAFLEETLEPQSATLVIGKQFPLRSRKAAFSLSLGLVRQWRTVYRPNLLEDHNPPWRILLRPNMEF